MLGGLSVISHKGDTICDFLFAFMHAKPLLNHDPAEPGYALPLQTV